MSLEDAVGSLTEQLLACVEQISVAKQSGQDISDLAGEGSLLFAELKRLNRSAHVGSRGVRDETDQAKHRVDKLNLRLQNLLFERAHLHAEVLKCRQFQSRHDQIDLIGEEELAATGAVMADSEHERLLARLNWELEERGVLKDRVVELGARKQAFVSQSNAERDVLASLPEKLQSVIQSVEPLQTVLGVPQQATRARHESNARSRLLPRPLFVLFAQAQAYADAFEASDSFVVEITGDIAAAEANAVRESSQTTPMAIDEHDATTTSTIPSLESRRRELFEHHDLSVTIQMRCADSVLVSLCFGFVPLLEAVTVRVAVDSNTLPSQHSSTDLFANTMLFHSLFPSDSGLTLPCTSGAHRLDSIGVLASDVCGELCSSGEERVFQWAQWLAGLESVSATSEQSVVTEVVQRRRFRQCVEALRQRVHSRVALHTQFTALSAVSGVSPTTLPGIPSELRDALFPIAATSKLSNIEWTSDAQTGSYRFSATLSASSSSSSSSTPSNVAPSRLTLSALLSPDYPVCPARFSMSFTGKSSLDQTELDANLAAIHREVNIHSLSAIGRTYDSLSFTCQLRTAQMCFDLFRASDQKPAEALRKGHGRLFVHCVSGPDRLRPFVYNKELGMFEQRS